VVAATVRGGAPGDTAGFRAVEGEGFLLWVDRSLQFRGEGIDLDVGFAGSRKVVYATNYISR